MVRGTPTSKSLPQSGKGKKLNDLPKGTQLIDSQSWAFGRCLSLDVRGQTQKPSDTLLSSLTSIHCPGALFLWFGELPSEG